MQYCIDTAIIISWIELNHRANEPRRRATDPQPPPQPAQRRMSSLSLDDDDSTATRYRTHNPLLANNCATAPSPRSTSVTFAPLPPAPGRGSNKARAPPTRQRGRGNRRDYSLGDILRCSSHMIGNYSTPEQAFQSINSLKNRDFAFVREFDGTFTYAILACRSLEPPLDAQNSLETLEECMVFVLCDKGSTIKLRKNEWVHTIRLVAMDGLDPRSRSRKVEDETSDKNDGEWSPPNIISFVPTTCDGNDATSGVTPASSCTLKDVSN